MYYTESDGNSYPAKKRIRAIDRSKVTTWSREIVNCNILEVEAGTNGYQGGDSGHGSRTYLRLKDLGSTDIRCNVEADQFGCDSIEIILGGDAELAGDIVVVTSAVSMLTMFLWVFLFKSLGMF